MAEPVLLAAGLTRRFGGLAAVQDVSITLERGAVHALLGPNGAGKSTLINLLSGDLAASAGTIRHRGRDITRMSPDARSRAGIGRSYQKTNIFPAFSAFENCRLAAQSRAPHASRLFTAAHQFSDTNGRAREALARAGLADCGAQPAGTLSHGEQRQLELAMVLATDPDVLLLDEPLAGMGAEEAQRMIRLLGDLRADHAILLVEHDMDAVFAVANTITVMVEGKVLESGSPDAIRRSPAVQQAYLGEDASMGAS